jgi:hypothetical protein
MTLIILLFSFLGSSFGTDIPPHGSAYPDERGFGVSCV